MIRPLLMTVLAVARMPPLRPAAPPIVRTEFGARKRDEPLFSWRELTLKEAPRLEDAVVRRMFWSLKSVPRNSSDCRARMLDVAEV